MLASNLRKRFSLQLDNAYAITQSPLSPQLSAATRDHYDALPPILAPPMILGSWRRSIRKLRIVVAAPPHRPPTPRNPPRRNPRTIQYRELHVRERINRGAHCSGCVTTSACDPMRYRIYTAKFGFCQCRYRRPLRDWPFYWSFESLSIRPSLWVGSMARIWSATSRAFACWPIRCRQRPFLASASASVKFSP